MTVNEIIEHIKAIYQGFADAFKKVEIKDVYSDLAIGLIVAVFTFLITSTFKLRLPSLARLFFWRKLSDELVVISSEVMLEFDPFIRSGRQFSLVPTSEVLAISKILSYFKTNFKKDIRFTSIQTHHDFDSVKHKNLFIVGGPKYNLASMNVLKAIDNRITYQFRRIREETILSANDIEYKKFVSSDINFPELALDINIDKDYSTVIVIPNIYCEGKFIVLVGGLNQLSTLSAVEWLLNIKGPTLLRQIYLNKGFQAIISCKVNDNIRATNITKEYMLKVKP